MSEHDLFEMVKGDAILVDRILMKNPYDGDGVKWVDRQDDDSNMLIHLAQSEDMVKVLVKHGADVEAQNYMGVTPLMTASNASVAKALMEHGADVNALDVDSKTPLHLTNKPDVAKVLIENGADVNAKDERDKTPLHMAVNGDVVLLLNPDVALVLIEAGADVNAKDQYGRTPLHYAFDGDSVDLLLNNGADPMAKSHCGYPHEFKQHPSKKAAYEKAVIQQALQHSDKARDATQEHQRVSGQVSEDPAPVMKRSRRM